MSFPHGRVVAPVCVLVVAALVPLAAQDRLRTMPGYERYQKMSAEIPRSATLGALIVDWKADGSSFEYPWGGKLYRFDVATKQATVIGDAPDGVVRGRGRGRGGQGQPDRGRQFDTAESPDRKLKAFYKDRNVWLGNPDGSDTVALTTEGSELSRVKYGTASWVYGEELAQRTAMWWSPDSRRLAYYRFDESKVPDYYLQMNQTKVQDTLDVEAYPKPGKPNPVVDLFVYNVSTKQTKQLDVRDGKPFENATVGYYAYGIEWTRDGRELLVHRSNRRQNVMELAACAPDTGTCRTVIREEWPTGWISENRDWRFLKDGRRLIWSSERNGWKNYYLYDLSGTLIAPLTTSTTHEAASIVSVDEATGTLFYTARDGDNPLKLQLHRVGLDGKGDRRLTDPALTHTITPSPDSRYFIDVAQAHDVPPATRLIDASGRVVAELAKSDMTKFESLGLRKTEMFTFQAADGKTALRGTIQFPSNFDPSRKYPVLIPVYGGPAFASNTASERFTTPNPITELGFLIVNLDSRAIVGLGKRALDSVYLKLGQTEIDDMAEGVKALASRPYVDAARIGIYGTSYGGYASLMSVLRHPDLFAAASASSPPTDWRNYDTIYTERYMWIPEENRAGYDAGSAMTYADKLRSRLLIYYGSSDNNVHPSNSLQLIKALQAAGKSFEVQVGPDMGHSGVNQQRMLEFFIDNLIVNHAADAGSR